MQILNNVVQTLMTQNNVLLAQYKQISKCNTVQISLNPLNRSSVDLVYNIITHVQFQAERNNLLNKNDIHVILDSNGGDADAAYHIAKIIDQNFSGTIKYIIPRFAKSAATLLACGGNKIVMGETSEFGAA